VLIILYTAMNLPPGHLRIRSVHASSAQGRCPFEQPNLVTGAGRIREIGEVIPARSISPGPGFLDRADLRDPSLNERSFSSRLKPGRHHASRPCPCS